MWGNFYIRNPIEMLRLEKINFSIIMKLFIISSLLIVADVQRLNIKYQGVFRIIFCIIKRFSFFFANMM